jgi:hypothetical protein
MRLSDCKTKEAGSANMWQYCRRRSLLWVDRITEGMAVPLVLCFSGIDMITRIDPSGDTVLVDWQVACKAWAE